MRLTAESTQRTCALWGLANYPSFIRVKRSNIGSSFTPSTIRLPVLSLSRGSAGLGSRQSSTFLIVSFSRLPVVLLLLSWRLSNREPWTSWRTLSRYDIGQLIELAGRKSHKRTAPPQLSSSGGHGLDYFRFLDVSLPLVFHLPVLRARRTKCSAVPISCPTNKRKKLISRCRVPFLSATELFAPVRSIKLIK